MKVTDFNFVIVVRHCKGKSGSISLTDDSREAVPSDRHQTDQSTAERLHIRQLDMQPLRGRCWWGYAVPPR